MSSSEFLIMINALVLGFRHGIDWDHIAALMDITSATVVPNTMQGSYWSNSARSRALLLSGLYALGHCLVVILLGMVACTFAGIIPSWLDQTMERVVGLTLFVFGTAIAFVVVRVLKSGADCTPVSRLGLLAQALQGMVATVGRASGRLWQQAARQPAFITAQGGGSDESSFAYGRRTAFGLGMIHGAGVETASQVVLLAALGTSSNKVFAACVLTNFSVGFLASIMLIALFCAQGMKSLGQFKPLYLALSFATAVFSMSIGCLLMSGNSALLPDLSKAIFQL
jgi:high-affinity nickel-transport protein